MREKAAFATFHLKLECKGLDMESGEISVDT